jgi:hypothetical protein
MSIFSILILGTILIPLCLGFSFYPFIPESILNYWVCKDFLALLFAGIIFSISINKQGLRAQSNPWPAILVGYIVIHNFIVPKFEIENKTDRMIVTLWEYLPIAFSLVYYLFFLSIQNICVTSRRKQVLMRTLMWIGFLSAVYLVFQFFGLDERQDLNTFTDTKSTDSASLTSFLTHPNYAGSFVAMCIPFALYFQRWWMSALMAVSVVLTQSHIAIGGLVLGVAFYAWFSMNLSYRWLFLVCYFLLFSLYGVLNHVGILGFPIDNGRLNVWFLMWEDIKQLPLFGHGFGSFRILFQVEHGINWAAAHNELWQFIYECGFVGGMILISGCWKILEDAFIEIKENGIMLALCASFIITLVCSFGQFIYQLEPFRFVTIAIVGCIVSITNQYEKKVRADY